MTDHADCVPRAALLRLAEDMARLAAAEAALADEGGVRGYYAVHAGRSAAWDEASHALRSVAGLPPRAPTVDLTKEEP